MSKSAARSPSQINGVVGLFDRWRVLLSATGSATASGAVASLVLATAGHLASTGARRVFDRRTQLRVKLGAALNASDRRADADAAFRTALSLARRTGDGTLIAQAILGAVGDPVTILRVDPEKVALLEEALSRLPEARSPERAQVQASLAVELAYDADATRRARLSDEALNAARELNDPRTLAAALGSWHVVHWGPDHTPERLALATEMLELARRSEDAELELQARTWRGVDLCELGDGAAVDTELDSYAATATRSQSSAYG